MRLPAWAGSRWVVVPGLLALLIGGWNLYVAAHAHGTIAGRVVDTSGRPVAGATVTMFNRNFITAEARKHVTTDSDGRFLITGNDSHAVQLEAEMPGRARGPRIPLRLWFRGQDVSLAQPLVLPAS